MKTLKNFSLYIRLALVFVPVFSSAQVWCAEEKTERAFENIPVSYESWVYSDEYDTSSGNNNYGNANNEILYDFTIVQPAIVVVSTSGSSLDETSLCLRGRELYAAEMTEYFSDNSTISEREREMIDRLVHDMGTDLPENIGAIKERQALICVELQAGYYSVYSEGSDIGHPNNGMIKTGIYVCYLGQNMENAIDLGVQDCAFKTQCIHMVNSFETSGELYFKIELPTFTRMFVDGVGVRGTYGKLAVLDASGKELYNSDRYPSKKYYPQIDDCQLVAGTYYIRSYMEQGIGELFVNIRSVPAVRLGDSMERPYMPSSFFSNCTYSPRYNTDSYTDRHMANSRKDVFIGLRLLVPFNVVMEDNDSSVQGGIIATLADSKGVQIVCLDTSDDPMRQVSVDVPSGFYYLILEGAENDGEVGVKLVMTKLDSLLVKNNFVPDAASNYIVTAVPAVEVISGGEDSQGGNMKFVVDYYDGLGRFDQSVSQRGILDKSVVLSCVEYDLMGRPVISWNTMPGHPDGGLMSRTDVAESAETFYRDKAPYTTTIYADSPLEQVAKRFGPGEIWRRDSSSVDIKYNTDTLTRYAVAGERDNGRLVIDGHYESGELRIEEIRDENGYLTKKYIDCYGQDVCVEREGLRTFYVYDSYGNLRFVLPPCVNGRIDQQTLWEYAYAYNYDDRNLCLGKRIPGANWILFLYDKSGYPVYSQDGEQRVRGEWICSIPDVFGREVIRGVASSVPDASDLRQYNVFADFDAAYPYGYRVNGVEAPENLLSVRYYDNYDFIFLDGTPEALRYMESSEYGRRYGTDIDYFKHKGLLTGSYDRVLGNEADSVWTASYYDINQQPIQTRRLLPLGGEHIVKCRYNFDGTVALSEEVVRPCRDAVCDTMLTSNEYDAEGRLCETSVFFNGAQMSGTDYVYDEIGRLSSVAQGGEGKTIDTQMRYNVRNWMVSSRNSEFESELRYVDSLSHDVPADYSGNVSEWSWRNGDSGVHTYGFWYDAHSRLTDAVLYGLSGDTDSFTESGMVYDDNGNILHIDRTSCDTLSSRLEYEYSGNQLNVVNDGVFGKSWSYLYNQNGQMFYDGRNGLLFTYNIAGLPYQCGTLDSLFVTYSYLPDGLKLSAVNSSGDGLYYIGPMVYRKSGGSMSFEEASFPGGRIVGTDSGAIPYYYLTDHLGSTRAIVDGVSGEVVERDDYYPFGSRWRSGPEVPWNRYRFNGKEWQNFAGLPYIDYGARMYDPQWRLSWNAIDPFAEKYYSFCSNNPVNFVDWDGGFPFVANLVGGIASAAVDYTGQVIANIVKYKGISASSFLNVDVGDVAISFGEGFVTVGGNIVKKVATKAAIAVVSEVARNAVDVEVGNGNGVALDVNSVSETAVNTAVGLTMGSFSTGMKVKPLKTQGANSAVSSVRSKAHTNGKGLSAKEAKSVAQKTRAKNELKKVVNKVVEDNVNAVVGNTSSSVVKKMFEED